MNENDTDLRGLKLNNMIQSFMFENTIIEIRLRVLLAERNLKMADVIRDIGISKTAIRGLYYESSKGIQFETLVKICNYLCCGIEDLLVLKKSNELIMEGI